MGLQDIKSQLKKARTQINATETNVNPITCDDETLAYFSRPDRLQAKEEAIANYTMMKAMASFQWELYMKVYETLSESYPLL